jgi:hypothetical protein
VYVVVPDERRTFKKQIKGKFSTRLFSEVFYLEKLASLSLMPRRPLPDGGGTGGAFRG